MQGQDCGPWCTTNMIREAVTAAWEQLLAFLPKPLRWPNKPLTKRSLRGFSFSCFSSVKHTVSPLRGEETLSIGQLFKLLPDSPCSASGMNKGANMTGMLRKRNSGWEMLSWRKYGFPHPVLWVHIVFRVILNLLWGVLMSPGWSSCWKTKKEWLRDRIILENLIFSPFCFLSHQGWLQHQGAAGVCGAARVCRPQPRPSTTVSRMINPNTEQRKSYDN